MLHEGCKRNDLQATMEAFHQLTHHGCEPNQNTVSAVLHACGERGDESAFRVVNEYIQSKDVVWRENEQLCNSLVLYKCKAGDYHGARDMFKEMQAKKMKIRHGAIWMLLDEVVYKQDATYAGELLKMCADIGVPPRTGEQLLQLAIAGGHHALATDLMAAYANVRQSVDREVACKFVDWLSSCCPGRYEVKSPVSIGKSGECGGCGHHLNSNVLTSAEHQMLLDHTSDMMSMEANSFQNNRRYVEEGHRLREVIKRESPFAAVVDGLNVAHISQTKANPSLLLAVLRQLSKQCSKTLVIARRHLADTDRAKLGQSQKLLRASNVHCFFTENRVADDCYFLYSTFLSGPNTWFFSNDALGDHLSTLPPHLQIIFRKWKRSRQVMITVNPIVFHYPNSYDEVVQWSPTNWHLPLQNGGWLCASQRPS